MKTIKYLSKFDKNLKILGHRKTIRFKRAKTQATISLQGMAEKGL